MFNLSMFEDAVSETRLRARKRQIYNQFKSIRREMRPKSLAKLLKMQQNMFSNYVFWNEKRNPCVGLPFGEKTTRSVGSPFGGEVSTAAPFTLSECA